MPFNPRQPFNSGKPVNTEQPDRPVNPAQPDLPRNPDTDPRGTSAEMNAPPDGANDLTMTSHLPLPSQYNPAPAVLKATTGRWPNKPQPEEGPQRLEPDPKLKVPMPLAHPPNVPEYRYALGDVGAGTAPLYTDVPQNFFGSKDEALEPATDNVKEKT